jgi:hypothetical protein
LRPAVGSVGVGGRIEYFVRHRIETASLACGAGHQATVQILRNPEQQLLHRVMISMDYD